MGHSRQWCLWQRLHVEVGGVVPNFVGERRPQILHLQFSHDGPEQHQQIQKRTFRPNAKTTRNKNTLSMKMARVTVEYLLDSNSHHFFAAEVYKIGLGTRLVCTSQNTSYCSVYSSACTSGLLRPQSFLVSRAFVFCFCLSCHLTPFTTDFLQALFSYRNFERSLTLSTDGRQVSYKKVYVILKTMKNGKLQHNSVKQNIRLSRKHKMMMFFYKATRKNFTVPRKEEILRWTETC